MESVQWFYGQSVDEISAWFYGQSVDEISAWFYGQSVDEISAVVLWIDCRWNRRSEPSQSLRASSTVGRAKSLVGIEDGAIYFGV